MKTFTVWRKNPPQIDHSYNEPDQPQFEGVIFSDGVVAVRWLTECRSVSIWDFFDDLIKVHGHEGEYQTEIRWGDGNVQKLG